MIKLKAIISIAFITSILACKDDPIDYDPIPQIDIVGIAPLIVNEFQDDITITISYIDGDGDLGENDPNALNLFVIDNRINLTQSFRIPQLSPDGAVIPIQGTLDVVIPGTGITDGSNQQSVTFSIYVIDRAGNESNQITSQPIIIKKP